MSFFRILATLIGLGIPNYTKYAHTSKLDSSVKYGFSVIFLKKFGKNEKRHPNLSFFRFLTTLIGFSAPNYTKYANTSKLDSGVKSVIFRIKSEKN